MAQAQLVWNGHRDFNALTRVQLPHRLGESFKELGYPRLGIGYLVERPRRQPFYAWVVPYYQDAQGRLRWHVRGALQSRYNPEAVGLETIVTEGSQVPFSQDQFGLQADGGFFHNIGTGSQYGRRGVIPLEKVLITGFLRRWQMHVSRWTGQVALWTADATVANVDNLPWQKDKFTWSCIYPVWRVQNATAGFSGFTCQAQIGTALLSQRRAQDVANRLLTRRANQAPKRLGNVIEEWTLECQNIVVSDGKVNAPTQSFQRLDPATNTTYPPDLLRTRAQRNARLGGTPPWPPSDRIYNDGGGNAGLGGNVNQQGLWTNALTPRYGRDQPIADGHHLWREYYQDLAWWIYQVFRLVVQPRLNTHMLNSNPVKYTPDVAIPRGVARIAVRLSMSKVMPWEVDADAPQGIACPIVAGDRPHYNGTLLDASDMIADPGWAIRLTQSFHRQQHQGEANVVGGYDVPYQPQDSDRQLDGTYNYAFTQGCRLQFMVFRQSRQPIGMDAVDAEGQPTLTSHLDLNPGLANYGPIPGGFQFVRYNNAVQWAPVAFCQPLNIVQAFMATADAGRYNQGWADDSWAYPMHCLLINALRGYLATKPVRRGKEKAKAVMY